jgi:hypothetical protein
MQKSKHKMSIAFVLFVSLFILQISNPSISVNSKTNLTFIEEIRIESDADFELFASSGDGSANKPYIIEKYNVTSSKSSGIIIRFTTKYFIVRNCYVTGHYTGINLIRISNGTGKIINNEVELNVKGIYLSSVNHSEIAYNNIVNNTMTGIQIGVEDTSSVAPLYGNIIHHNNLIANDWYFVNGVITPSSDHQAMDEGIENFWYDNSTNEGNYWDDYEGTGAYSIEGGTGSEDPYPLTEQADYATVETPLNYLVTVLSLSLAAMFVLTTRKNMKHK